jgi:glycosyltransferase involved in cell wall biosynthesis
MSHPRRIVLATDAWHPQVSGVVRTLDTTIRLLESAGHSVTLIEPGAFRSFPCPIYPEIPLSWPIPSRLDRLIREARPDHVHIATEGPIGIAVRRICARRGWQFTTSYHTNFPEYVRRMLRVPESLGYAYMRWFHRRSAAVMVATPSLEKQLAARGFRRPTRRWSRGVDLSLFYPRSKTFPSGHRPISMYVGRVSHEKGIDDFLRARTPGRKYVVGDGPIRPQLERQYPDAVFLGYRRGEALAEAYANADVFVFPSRTDTFGLVMIEAMACGVPVAAYPVPGPIDILTHEGVGCMHDDIGNAIGRALSHGTPLDCIELARSYTWANCTAQFLGNLVSARPARG